MKKHLWLFFLYSLLAISPSFAERQKLFIPREDGSLIKGYFDKPDNEAEVPVIIFIDGSFDVTVKMNHKGLIPLFNSCKIGLISLEKRGITSKKDMDVEEFKAHDCFEERLHDYSLLLKELSENKIAGCNGCYIVLGISEGGMIAPRLTLEFAPMLQGVVLVASGGGLPFAKEMKYQLKRNSKNSHVRAAKAFKMTSKDYDKLFKKMEKNPESLEIFAGKTWKWCASYLRYDLLADLLQIEIPIYMIHGAKDVLVPVKSADLVQEAFDQAGKTNLQYARYEDLGHEVRADVYADMMAWICERISLSSCAAH